MAEKPLLWVEVGAHTVRKAWAQWRGVESCVEWASAKGTQAA
jgi:hypothetical protein